MENEVDKLWEAIQQKEAETKELRKKHFDLIQAGEEEVLRKTYLGKYYLHKEYDDRWKTYVYVNELETKERCNRLNCTEFTIVYEDNSDEIYSVSCRTNHDFSCHYISKYSEDPDIDNCVEITREDFLNAQKIFEENFLKSFEA